MRRPTFNHLAVWASAVGASALAYVWFHLVFRAAFMNGLGKTDEELSLAHNTWEAVIIQFSGNLVTAYVIGWLFRHLSVTSINQGLALTSILWLGLVAAVITPLTMAEAFPLYFLALTAGGVLVQMVLMASVMSVWRAPDARS